MKLTNSDEVRAIVLSTIRHVLPIVLRRVGMGGHAKACREVADIESAIVVTTRCGVPTDARVVGRSAATARLAARVAADAARVAADGVDLPLAVRRIVYAVRIAASAAQAHADGAGTDSVEAAEFEATLERYHRPGEAGRDGPRGDQGSGDGSLADFPGPVAKGRFPKRRRLRFAYYSLPC